MDEANTTAVTTSEAPVTESAPVEESTVEATVEATEKSEITTGEEQVNQEVAEDQMIPKQRLDEVIKERNELREFRAQQEAQKQELEAKANMTPQDLQQKEQLEKAKETLKKLGFVTQEEVAKNEESNKAKNMFISECNRLEGKYDGKDGNPAFTAVEVAEFMDQQAQSGNLITDPEVAYKLRNMDAIINARAKAQKSTAYTETQSGGMNEVTDARQAELDAAGQTGDFREYLKKYAGIKKN